MLQCSCTLDLHQLANRTMLTEITEKVVNYTNHSKKPYDNARIASSCISSPDSYVPICKSTMVHAKQNAFFRFFPTIVNNFQAQSGRSWFASNYCGWPPLPPNFFLVKISLRFILTWSFSRWSARVELKQNLTRKITNQELMFRQKANLKNTTSLITRQDTMNRGGSNDKRLPSWFRNARY